jgi:hypothetical protein
MFDINARGRLEGHARQRRRPSLTERHRRRIWPD